MLELQNIKKDYPAGDGVVHALKGISLKFRDNDFVSILGPSGCGKTTMLNIIGGLDQYTEGDLIINGRSTKDFKDRDWDAYRNHSIGFVFQSYIIGKLIFRSNGLGEQSLQKIVRQLLLFLFIFRGIFILPRIDVMYRLFKAVKALLCRHRHIEFQCVKHHIRAFFVKRGIVDIGDKTHDLPFPFADCNCISHFQTYVVGVHTVDGDLVLFFGETAVHQAG